MNALKKIEEQNESIRYLSIFRIIIGTILLFNIWSYLSNWKMLYSHESFYEFYGNYNWLTIVFQNYVPSLRGNFNIFLIAYQFIVILLIFGIGKNWIAFAVFVCHYITQSLNPMILNGGDNLLIFLLFYLSFCDSFRFYSLTISKATPTKNIFTNLGIYSIKLHLCLIYFISAISKLNSDAWYNGIASYYTLNLERFRGMPFNHIISKNGYFITLSTYGVLLIELLFPFLIWFKRPRPYLIFGGILMHLALLLFMMIYDFELIFISIYGFFLSGFELQKLFSLKITLLKIKNFLTKHV